jgi:hypothetical protein
MPTSKYRVSVTHFPNVARVEGLLVKVVRKAKKDPGDPERFRRVVYGFEVATFVVGDNTPSNPNRWEMVLPLPTGNAKKRVIAYDIEIVVLDNANNLLTSYTRRLKAPINLRIPPFIIIAGKPGPRIPPIPIKSK